MESIRNHEAGKEEEHPQTIGPRHDAQPLSQLHEEKDRRDDSDGPGASIAAQRPDQQPAGSDDEGARNQPQDRVIAPKKACERVAHPIVADAIHVHEHGPMD